MTGYGDASCLRDGVAHAAEVRSVNNRYLKAVLRMPEPLLGLEPEFESLLRKRFTRGSITLTITSTDTSESAAYEINEAALQRYLSHLETVEKKAIKDLGDRGAVTIDLGSLLALPGIVQPPNQSRLIERYRPVLRELVNEACEKMLAMRRTEGGGLAEDLRAHVRSISQMLGTIRERAPHVAEEYHQRLHSRVDELLRRAKLRVEQTDLLREVAIYAERCDISEELQRLDAHLEQFHELLDRDESAPVGRTLDFVTQEMLREANTIASKSNDARISRTIVEIKGAIDRVKEQVQNVE